jgi:hypothetical protein
MDLHASQTRGCASCFKKKQKKGVSDAGRRMQHAEGDAPLEGARQPDLVEGEEVKYIKHSVSVFVDDDRCTPARFAF